MRLIAGHDPLDATSIDQPVSDYEAGLGQAVRGVRVGVPDVSALGGVEPGVQAMLDAIAASGEGSFLAVLKTFGHREAKGMLSFPQPGVTLRIDQVHGC
jgi:Asp-tRNA(Asn)/Glu-tRNA(Gln) amidotransferase A subunit family amidase